MVFQHTHDCTHTFAKPCIQNLAMNWRTSKFSLGKAERWRRKQSCFKLIFALGIKCNQSAVPSLFRARKGNFMLSGQKKKKNALRCNHFKTNKHTLLICVHLATLHVNHHWNRYPSSPASKCSQPTRPCLRNECTCQGKHLSASLPKHLLLVPGKSITGKCKRTQVLLKGYWK